MTKVFIVKFLVSYKNAKSVSDVLLKSKIQELSGDSHSKQNCI